jgi:hypothetical protein
VWEHSPYASGKLVVHLALADKTAEEYGHLAWSTQAKIAERTRLGRQRVNEILGEMVTDGWIEPISWEELPAEAQAQVEDRRAKFFRVLLCRKCAQHWGLPGRAEEPVAFDDTSPDATCRLLTPDMSPLGNSHLLSTQRTQLREMRALDEIDLAAEPLYGFDHFWRTYPKRNGRLIGKGLCQKRWKKMNLDERRAAWRGAAHYAADVTAGKTIAKDPDRWLRDRLWEDWDTPADPDAQAKFVTTQEVAYDPDKDTRAI